MKEIKYNGKTVPQIFLGDPKSSCIYLYLHGKNGSKEEASLLANIVSKHGYCVMGIDLPGHGESSDSIDNFNPWYVSGLLNEVWSELCKSYGRIRVFANSIGAYFIMNTPCFKTAEKALFVSPIVNMEKLITNMMYAAGVTESELNRKKIIETSFGETLSIEYLNYVRNHEIICSVPTSVLYGKNDNLTDENTINEFVNAAKASLTVLADGGHWFHTQNELSALSDFIKNYGI